MRIIVPKRLATTASKLQALGMKRLPCTVNNVRFLSSHDGTDLDSKTHVHFRASPIDRIGSKSDISI